MASLTVKNVKIVGMSACVPPRVEENRTLTIYANPEEAEKIIASTGIERRHLVDDGVTSSDLAVVAAEKLISDLGWEKESIDCLIFASQTRDYIAPQTACILQHRLGLSQGMFAIDTPLGCSGFVHGMSLIASLISHGGLKRGLLINAETNSRNRSMDDRTVRPLFGDAATVTAVEFDASASPMHFVYGVDGSGANAIMTPYGGMRNPTTVESLQPVEVEPGVIRKGTDMVIRGMDVFAFAIKRPPLSIKELIATFAIDVDKIDLLLLHQANKFIDEKIRKSIKVPEEKTPYCLHEYGNVTSASIPLTLVSQCREQLTTRTNSCLACGFGIGLEWGTMAFDINNIVCTEVLTYN